MNVLTASQIDIVLSVLTPVVPDQWSAAGNFKSIFSYIDAATILGCCVVGNLRIVADFILRSFLYINATTILGCRVIGNLRIAAHGNLTVFTYIHSTAASGFIAADFRIIGHN